ncbi:hypothetical protein EC957_008682 [Mortierella hygrophila]|uniref:FAD-binding domain-containing protein n=1 Tax=Mortierella hygrophila TaxID=979708 RepID=A0A9P6EWV7_9FUNG|nr:hypothetical protein EC957_008682 [Mortierella hygrophila]
MSSNDKPTVLIVGAGLGGLMLGALLEKSNVPYTIFERAAMVKPLGSAMAVGPTLLPIFQQMGIYDDIAATGKYGCHIYSHRESLEPYRPQDYSVMKEYTGYGRYIIARPDYYNIMLKQVPAHKVLFGHRVLNITEDDDKVTVHLSNNQTYKGDIIVGADGAYSAVRQRMYEQLKAKDLLPKEDQEDLPFSSTSLVGQTKVLDPEEFPIVNKPHCQFLGFLGDDKPYTWCVMSTTQKTLCWMAIHHLSKKTSKEAMEQRFRNSENSGEWGAAPAQTMCDETRNFPLQLGDGKKWTMGDLYDLTPKELISKVMLEEKVFKTWHHGRYVLMGDACHKLSPSGGHGAVTAMHDAITLANLIYVMPTKTSDDITRIFEEYKKERYPAVMASYKSSQIMAKAIENSIIGKLILFLMTRMPIWLWKLSLKKTIMYRPQVGFLPNIPLQGSVVPIVSPSEQKARALFEKQQQQDQQAASI